MRKASMNHTYRLIWSDRAGAFIAVAENAKARGKSSRIGQAIAISAGMLFPLFAHAGGVIVAPGSGATNVYAAPNGVPVVDIDKANAAGLSHNKYLHYNVNTNGLVLNNANSSQMTRQSQLAGQVMANMNLSAEARVILNEVVAPNRSQLLGYTEVLGGKADVIVANPYGITCNGCGFINSDRATLTTGTPNILGSGALGGFTVNQGDVLVTGAGLDGTAQTYLDIVARSVRLEAQVNAVDLKIATGANNWNYATQTATANAPAGAAPGLAFDSTVLGGMYANRIRIHATEAGVGVRMLGDAAATADDLTIDAAGKIDVRSKVSAERNLALTSTAAGADAIGLTDASVSAKQNLSLTASSGGATLTGGLLVAGNNLAGILGSLTDTASAAAIADNNKRYAGLNSTLTVTNAASLDGTTWGAGGAINHNLGSLTTGAAGATIHAGTTLDITANTGDLALNAAAISSVGNLALASTNGAITVTADAAQGIQSTTGNIALTAGNGLNNAGNITADAGSMALRTSGAVNNSGLLHAAISLSIADKNNGSTETLTNSGTIYAQGDSSTSGTLSINAASLNNSGIIQGNNTATVSAANTSGNSIDNSGTIYGIGALSIGSGAGINNSGTVYGAGALSLNGVTGISNSGTVYGVGALNLSAASINNSGAIQGDDIATFTATSTSGNSIDNSGTIYGVGILNLVSGAGISNSGTVYGSSAATLTAANTSGNSIVNSGTVYGAGALNLSGASIVNSGTVYGDNTATLTAANTSGNSIGNSGTVYSAGALSISGASIINSGAIQGDSSATFTAANTSGNSIDNSGTIYGVGALNLVSAAGINNSGVIQGDNTATLTAANTGSNSIGNSGTIYGAGALSLSASNISNSGTIQGDGAATLTAASTSGNSIDNSGTIYGVGALGLTSGANINNAGAGKILGGSTLSLGTTAGSANLTNAGRIQSAGAMTIGSAGHAINLDNSTAYNRTNQTGSNIMSGGTLSFTGGNLSNQGFMQAVNGMNLNGSGALTNGSPSNSGALILAASGTAAAGYKTISALSLSNYGAIHSNDDLTVGTTGGSGISNTSTGGISSLLTLSLTTNGAGPIDNYGALYAGGAMNLSAANNSIYNQQNATIDGDGTVTTTSANFYNYAAIRATNITFTTSGTFFNGLASAPTIVLGAPSYSWDITGLAPTIAAWSQGGVSPDGAWLHEGNITYQQQLSSALPAVKPQVLATNTLNLNYGGGSATNRAGILSADTVNISGSGTFTNEDFHLDTITYAVREKTYEHNPTTGSSWFDTFYPTDLTQFDTGLDCVNCTFHPGSEQEAILLSYKKEISRTTYWTSGAGVFGRSVSFTGGTIISRGSPYAVSTSALTQTAAGAASAPTYTPSAVNASAPTHASASTPASVTLGGFTVTVPTNPNGYFVVSQNPQSQYLVETNPLYAAGSTFVGSDYMTKRLGLNTDEIGLRLGDAAYESYLIRQQLISQIGNNILKGYANEQSMIQNLYASGADLAGSMGLMWGQPLLPEQIANLDQDIVWMVETTVAGKTVLAPVVYLSAATKAGVETGAVIAGNQVDMDVDSFSNTGGTVRGSDSLSIKSRGDITNISGTLRGGNVNLTSSGGSIVNKTLAEGNGDALSFKTNIGKTAGIEATKNLGMNAAKNITVLGANVSAGGNANLKAGGAITFDTIVDKSTKSAGSASNSGFSSQSSNTTTTTEKNIGSGLTVGGNLGLTSGGDTTIAGSKVKVGGDLDVDTGGSFNVIARQDKVTTKTSTQKSGLGVGGGVYGSNETTTDSFKGTNAGSTVTAGGNATVKTGKDVVLQGSDLNIAGDADIDAKGSIKVLDGLDEERTKTHSKTTTFLSIDSSSSSGSSSGSAAGTGNASAFAGTGAEGSAGNSTEINLAKTTVTDSLKTSKTSVASNLKVGGNLNAKAGDKVTIQGSNVEAGGDTNIDAQDVEVLAGRNESYEKSTTTTTKIGIFIDSDAGGSANASAKATGMTANAKAGAEAEGSANSVATIGVRTETSEQTSDKLTHTGSTIKSGGNMSLTAKNQATFQGAEVEGGGDLNIKAKDITSLAAEDREVTTSKSTRQTAGIYLDASAEGSASAQAKANPLGTGAKAEVGVKAEASAGLRYAREEESSEEGSTTNVVNSFKAGNNLTRTAEGTIRDQGTQLEAGGNIGQSATRLVEDEISDKSWSSSSSESHDGRIGVYAGGEAGASAGAQKGVGGSAAGASADGSASAGIKGKYTFESSSEKSGSTTAVTSSYKAGGNITSKTKEETKLVGTKMEAGGDIDIEAKKLDFQAAKDTTQESSSDRSAEGEVKVKLVGDKGLEASGGYEQESGTGSTSTAVTGKLSSTGGNIRIKTQDDARFEGTEIEAEKNVNIASEKGNVKFDAAKSTATERSDGFEVSAELKVGAKDAEGGASGGFNKSEASEVTNTVTTIKSKSGNVDITAGKDATFEGTEVTAGGDTTIAAKGNVNLLEAKDSKQENAIGFSAETAISKDDQSASFNVNAKNVDKQTGSATKISSGGKTSIAGETVVSQEAELKAGSGTEITGKTKNIAKTNVDKGFELDIDLDVTRSSGGGDSDSDKNDSGGDDGGNNKPRNKEPDNGGSANNNQDGPDKPRSQTNGNDKPAGDKNKAADTAAPEGGKPGDDGNGSAKKNAGQPDGAPSGGDEGDDGELSVEVGEEFKGSLGSGPNVPVETAEEEPAEPAAPSTPPAQ